MDDATAQLGASRGAARPYLVVGVMTTAGRRASSHATRHPNVRPPFNDDVLMLKDPTFGR